MDVLNGPCATLNEILCTLNGHGRALGIHILCPNYSIRDNKEFLSFMVIYITFNIMTIHAFTAAKDDFIQTAFWCVTLAFQIQVSTVTKRSLYSSTYSTALPVSGQVAFLSRSPR